MRYSKSAPIALLAIFVFLADGIVAETLESGAERLLLKELLLESPALPSATMRERLFQLSEQKRESNDLTKGPGTADISGVASDAGAATIADLRVYLHEYNPTTGGFSQVGNTTTNGSGYYEFTALPAATYLLTSTDDISNSGYIWLIWDASGGVPCRSLWNCEIMAGNQIVLAAGGSSTNNLSVQIGGTIAGNVHDASSMVGVTTLRAYAVDPASGYSVYSLPDAAGNYGIGGLPNANFKVYLTPGGSFSNQHVCQLYGAGECNPNLCAGNAYNGMGSDVVISTFNAITGIDFALRTGAKISGRLLDAVTITAIDSNFGIVYVFDETNRAVAAIDTDGLATDAMATGDYSIGGLLPGDYFVQGDGRGMYVREVYNGVHCPWTGCNRSGFGNAVSLLPTEHRSGLNFFLNKGGKIAGAIRDGMGANISGESWVQVYDGSGSVVGGGFSFTDDGNYELGKAIPPGSYVVKSGNMWTNTYHNKPLVDERHDGVACPGESCDLSTAGALIAVAYNTTTTGVNFDLDTGYELSGTVTDLGGGSPIPDVYVLIYDSTGRFAASDITDASGNFTVTGLPAGTFYALTNNGSRLPFHGLWPSGSPGFVDILHDNIPCPGGSCTVTSGDPIVLPARGASSDVDFILTGGATISGMVSNEITGEAIPSCMVEVFDGVGAFKGAYFSDSAGQYQTVGLEQGTYYLKTRNPGFLLDESFGGDYCVDGDCDPLTAYPVVLSQPDEQLSGIDFSLKRQYVFSDDF